MDHRIENIEGWMHKKELEWLFKEATQIPENSLIVEIGAWMGRSSAALYTGSDFNKTVVSIDTWKGSEEHQPYNPAENKDIFEIYKKNMRMFGIEPKNYLDYYPQKPNRIQGNFYIKGDSVESAKYFEDESIDWLFIDGYHKGLSGDLDAYIPKLKIGGLLSGHDYFCFYDSIQQEIHKRFYINQIVESIWIKFIGEYCPEWYRNEFENQEAWLD